MNTSEVLYQDHFKLYVEPEDFVSFETKLISEGIQYYCNSNEQSFLGYQIRMFLLNSDRQKIDELIIQKQIRASVETIPSQLQKDRKMLKLFYIVGIVVTLGSLLLALI